jgi:hypothetical protein
MNLIEKVHCYQSKIVFFIASLSIVIQLALLAIFWPGGHNHDSIFYLYKIEVEQLSILASSWEGTILYSALVQIGHYFTRDLGSIFLLRLLLFNYLSFRLLQALQTMCKEKAIFIWPLYALNIPLMSLLVEEERDFLFAICATISFCLFFHYLFSNKFTTKRIFYVLAWTSICALLRNEGLLILLCFTLAIISLKVIKKNAVIVFGLILSLPIVLLVTTLDKKTVPWFNDYCQFAIMPFYQHVIATSGKVPLPEETARLEKINDGMVTLDERHFCLELVQDSYFDFFKFRWNQSRLLASRLGPRHPDNENYIGSIIAEYESNLPFSVHELSSGLILAKAGDKKELSAKIESILSHFFFPRILPYPIAITTLCLLLIFGRSCVIRASFAAILLVWLAISWLLAHEMKPKYFTYLLFSWPLTIGLLLSTLPKLSFTRFAKTKKP